MPRAHTQRFLENVATVDDARVDVCYRCGEACELKLYPPSRNELLSMVACRDHAACLQRVETLFRLRLRLDTGLRDGRNAILRAYARDAQR